LDLRTSCRLRKKPWHRNWVEFTNSNNWQNILEIHTIIKIQAHDQSIKLHWCASLSARFVTTESMAQLDSYTDA
jgi:hypothetical protein